MGNLSNLIPNMRPCQRSHCTIWKLAQGSCPAGFLLFKTKNSKEDFSVDYGTREVNTMNKI